MTVADTRNRYLGLLVMAVVLAVLPMRLEGDYALGLGVIIGINTIIVLGLNLLMGYAGQVSLGQAAFVGIGAYTSAILTVNHGWPPWCGLAAAIGLSALVAAAVGVPLLRLHGHYLAMGTLGFGIIVHIVMVQWGSLTNSTDGIAGIPPLALGPVTFGSSRSMYFLTAAAVLLCLALAGNIIDSRAGRALRAVHGSEIAASISGVDVARNKLQVFALSGALAGLAGGLFAHYMTYINPDSFQLGYSIQLLVMAVIGGMASIWGAVFGAAAVTLIGEQLRSLLEVSPIIFGFVVMLIVVAVSTGRAPGVEGGVPSPRTSGLRAVMVLGILLLAYAFPAVHLGRGTRAWIGYAVAGAVLCVGSIVVWRRGQADQTGAERVN